MYSTEQACQFQRSRNVGRNIIFGSLNRFVLLLLPFVVRTVLIYRFGAIYLGMNSLLSSIFQVLNLAELGFGTAVVYSLYKPVAEGDTDMVCAYLGTYSKIYRAIGLVIIGAGLALMPFFPFLVKDNSVPAHMNLFVWYLIFLAYTSISYLLYGYKTAIPSALQRNDLLSKIDTVILACASAVKICCLLLTDNFYFYLLVSLLFTVLRNLLISHVVDSCFPQYVGRGSISQGQFVELKLLVCGLALSRFRGASRHMIDNICITAFVSLTLTAIYSNYFLIHSAVVSVSNIICNAMMASVGNSIAMESKEKNYRDMSLFNFMYMLLAGWTTVCMFCLYQPFVHFWVGPKLMLGMPEVIALCLYYYVLKMGDMRWIYHQGAGLWWKARYFVIAEITCNVVLNILLAKYLGVLGIILATLISLFFINFIGGARVLFKEYFKNGKLHVFFCEQALYFSVTVVIAVFCMWTCEGVSGWMLSMNRSLEQSKLFELAGLTVRLLVCTLITVSGYFLIYHRSERFWDAKEWISKRFTLIPSVK